MCICMFVCTITTFCDPKLNESDGVPFTIIPWPSRLCSEDRLYKYPNCPPYRVSWHLKWQIAFAHTCDNTYCPPNQSFSFRPQADLIPVQLVVGKEPCHDKCRILSTWNSVILRTRYSFNIILKRVTCRGEGRRRIMTPNATYCHLRWEWISYSSHPRFALNFFLFFYFSHLIDEFFSPVTFRTRFLTRKLLLLDVSIYPNCTQMGSCRSASHRCCTCIIILRYSEPCVMIKISLLWPTWHMK
jgi:hypothetical protein